MIFLNTQTSMTLKHFYFQQILRKPLFQFWLSSRNFFRGAKSIVMQISIVILLFSDQISGRGESFREGKLPQGAPPAPLWKKARIDHCFQFQSLLVLGQNFCHASYFHWKEAIDKAIPCQLLHSCIRNNDQIKGLKIDDSIIKLSAYPDDTYFIELDVPSLQQVIIVCNIFEEFSSLKINLDKFQACWIGSAKGKLDTPINCNWVNIEKDKIFTLGIFNSYDQSLAYKYNFLNLITSMKDSLSVWEYRGLTLAGRMQIFKCLSLFENFIRLHYVISIETVHRSVKFL